MLKLSSKIIISILLAVMLWGGISALKIKEADAIIGGGWYAPEDSQSSTETAPEDNYDDIIEGANLAEEIAGIPSPEQKFPEFKKPDLSQMFLEASLWILTKILYVLLLLVNFLYAVSASILDYAITYSIVDITDKLDSIDGAIRLTWSLVRNFLNVTFIFVLLWISIKTILGLSTADTKKILTSTVVAALLINFSLFTTRIILDASNYTSVAMYSIALSRTKPDEDGNKLLSSAITEGTGLSTLYKTDKEQDSLMGANEVPTGLTTDVPIGIAIQIILGCIAIWTFLTAALLFMIRIIVFIILMILSPIGFVGDMIPYFKPHSKRWWDTLYSQALVAPVFFLFMLMIITVINSAAFASIEKKSIDFVAYFNFAMIAALLIATVKITKKLSGEAGATLSKLGAGAVGLGLGLASGGTALLATKALGGGASMLMNKYGAGLKDNGGFAARMALKTLDKTSKSSFDVRNTAAAGLMKKTGFDINRGPKGEKGGFQGGIDRRTKRDEEYAKFATKDMDQENLTDQEMIDKKTQMMAADSADVAAKKAAKQAAMDAKDAELLALTNVNLATRQKETARIMAEKAKLQAERDAIKQKDFTDEEIKKEIIKKKKEARLEKLAQLADKKGRKASAAKVRKLKGEKSSDDILRELAKKKAEEDAAAGINQTPPPPVPPTP